MDTSNLNAMLNQLHAAANQAAIGDASNISKDNPSGLGTDFSTLLQSTIDQVNQTQKSAQDNQKSLVAGDPQTNLQDVMLNLQKASLSFQAMVQVRNKLVSAYQEVMNMQV